MIHRLLNIRRPLIVLDVEATGLDPKEARIIEIGFQIWTEVGLLKEWRSLVNPGVPIPPETTKIHNISDETFKRCRHCISLPQDHPAYQPSDDGTARCETFAPWPTFAQLAPNLAKGFVDCDFAGKNVRYDLRVFAAEFARTRVMWSYASARIVDADRLEHLGEPRTLSALYEKHVGKKPVDTHQALADVRMTTELIETQLQKYQTLPRDLDVLHATQWPGWIDPDGKFKFVDGVPCFGAWGKHANKSMRLVAKIDPQYYTKFICGPTSDFSKDVKKLAMEAVAGRFPEVK